MVDLMDGLARRIGGIALKDIVAMPSNIRSPGLYRDAEVVECFIRIKQGADIEELKHQERETEDDIDGLDDQCVNLGNLIQCGDKSKETPLLRRQSDRRKAKQKLAKIKEQLQLNAERPQEPKLMVKEIEDIVCLPQVTAVRAEAHSLIVFTVRATTTYANIRYHLGTWDVYFGDVAGIVKGKGDRDCYRLKRVKKGLIRDVSTPDFHNWDDGSFCFGGNYDRVDEYARRGDFLHGMQAITLYLATVRGDKSHLIPITFERDN